eukprot:3360278-Amphidinium_carterae.1
MAQVPPIKVAAARCLRGWGGCAGHKHCHSVASNSFEYRANVKGVLYRAAYPPRQPRKSWCMRLLVQCAVSITLTLVTSAGSLASKIAASKVDAP